MRLVLAAARDLHKARQRLDDNGMGDDGVWNLIERKENAMLRAIEKAAGLPRLSLGVKDSG